MLSHFVYGKMSLDFILTITFVASRVGLASGAYFQFLLPAYYQSEEFI